MGNVEIILSGAMKEYYPKPISVYAKTPREALQALKLIPELNPKTTRKRFLSKVRGCDQSVQLDRPIVGKKLFIDCEAELDAGDISGSGNNPYVRIVIGVLLVVAGIYASAAGSPNLGMALIGAGTSLILGGVIQILNPVEAEEEEKNKNKSLKQYQNTVNSGTPIPIILGKHKHGGHLFSLNTLSKSDLDLKLSELVGSIPKFNGSWVTLTNTLQEDTTTRDISPPGGRPGGGGDGRHLV